MKLFKASPQYFHQKFSDIHACLQQSSSVSARYVDLGVKTLRILCCSNEFLPLMERQLTFSLRAEAPSYDATMVIWKNPDIASEYPEPVQGFDLDLHQVLSINENAGVFRGYDEVDNTFYYSVSDLSPEEFIKQGHMFVRVFYDLLKTDDSNLVHGACVGLDGKGILFCARGQRGKSTLTVLSLLEGFEYVSDDYMVLSREEDRLYTYPIYSIITLSPTMYNELYDELDGTRFVSNNARKDKYVINIANCHDRFRTRYPIRACMFPQIVSDAEPSIVRIEGADKGRAIAQLAHSTMMQMGDMHDTATTRKLMDMIRGQEFFQINLCRDLHKNVTYLRNFIKSL